MTQALAPDGILVERADMSHTEHGCFDERRVGAEAQRPVEEYPLRCTMGVNVRVDGAGPKADGGKIVNGVRSAAAAAELMGIELPEGWELPPVEK